MISFQFADFLNANAPEYARLIATAYPHAGLGSNPTGNFISETIRNYVSVAWPLGGVYYQPGQGIVTSAAATKTDMLFYGDGYVNIHLYNVSPPGVYKYFVWLYGPSLGAVLTGEEPNYGTEMTLWTSTNVHNALVEESTVMIEIPKVPFKYIVFGNQDASAAIGTDNVRFSFTGLAAKKA